MPDPCPKCGGNLPAGATTCPACNQAASSQPRNVTVVAAAMLPVIGLIVFLGLAAGVIFGLVKLYHVVNKHSPAAHPTVIVDPTPPPRVVSSPPVAPVASVSPTSVDAIVKSLIPATAPLVLPAEAQAVTTPPPILNDFVPPIAAPGSKIILRGDGLAAVNHVEFVSSHGAVSVEGTIIYARNDQLIVTVPKVPFENDPIFLLVRSPGGVAIMADQHLGNTPWGTDGHLHDTAVNVRPGDEIDTRDGMIMTVQEGASISVGDNSLVLTDKNVTVKSHGKNCRIYYVAPVELSAGVSRQGLTEVPSVQVNTSMDAFRVKPAPPDSDP